MLAPGISQRVHNKPSPAHSVVPVVVGSTKRFYHKTGHCHGRAREHQGYRARHSRELEHLPAVFSIEHVIDAGK